MILLIVYFVKPCVMIHLEDVRRPLVYKDLKIVYLEPSMTFHFGCIECGQEYKRQKTISNLYVFLLLEYYYQDWEANAN